MACHRIPRAGVVVGHEIPEIEDRVHACDVELLVVCGTGGCGDCEEEVRFDFQFEGGGVFVEGGADGLEEEDGVGGFGGIFGVFPVDIETVEAEVFEEFDG